VTCSYITVVCHLLLFAQSVWSYFCVQICTLYNSRNPFPKTSSNVKTVKEQTFHKRSTNVPMSNRNETKKPLSSFPNLSYRRWSFLFCPGEQILDKIETICFQQEKSGNDIKTFWFRLQNDIGTFVLPFLTFRTTLKGRIQIHIKMMTGSGLDFHFNADPDPTFHFNEDIAVWPSCQRVNDGKARTTFTSYVKICAHHDMNWTYHFVIQLLKWWECKTPNICYLCCLCSWITTIYYLAGSRLKPKIMNADMCTFKR